MSRAFARLAGAILPVASLAALTGLLGPTAAAADIEGAQIRTAPAGTTLVEAVHAAGNGSWIAYAFPGAARRSLCCGEGWHPERVCRLGHSDSWYTYRPDSAPGPSGATVLLARVEEGRIDRLLAVSSSCSVDGRGETLTWIEDVSATASLAFLEPLVERAGRRVAHAAIAAVALHEGEAADRLLRSLALEGSDDVSEQAVFWLGEARGDRGLAVLEEVLAGPRRSRLGEKVVFAVSLSEAEGSRTLLEALARGDEGPDLQGEALFWVAQSGAPDVEETLLDVAERAASERLREKAVFAMSQLPAERAVDALVRALRVTSHADVRRQSLFWLANVDDPRAMDVIEGLLAD